VFLRRDLEDAILEFLYRAAPHCLGGGSPPRSALFDKVFYVLTPTVFLVGRSLSVPHRFASYVGRFLVVVSLWRHLRRWCCLVDCGGCRFARARISTGPTMYRVMSLLFLIVDCSSHVDCSCFLAVAISGAPCFVCVCMQCYHVSWVQHFNVLLHLLLI
jgi:hypothetical protein